MADIILNDEDILAPFTEETPVHESFINPIITCVNKNTIRSKENTSAIGQKADSSDFVATSQPLVVGSGFETQTGAVPFNVTKSGQMLYFIGQLKCLANTTSSPVVLATSPIPPVGYFYLNILVNGVRQEGLTIAPGTGQIYIYKPFSANDIINFNGFAIGDI